MVTKAGNDSIRRYGVEENYNKQNIEKELLLDSIELQELQDKFSNAEKLYTICFGKSVGVLTIFSGIKRERTLIEEMIGKNYYFNVLKKLMDNKTEEIFVADTQYDFIKLAGINVIVDGKVVASWVVTGILRDRILDVSDEAVIQYFSKTTTVDDFYKSVDLLRVISKKIFAKVNRRNSSRNDIQDDYIAGKRAEAEVKKNETMTRIVSMLGADRGFDQTINNILSAAGDFVDVSSINLLRVNKSRRTVGILGEWTNKGIRRNPGRVQNVAMTEFPMLSSKPCVISSDTVVPEHYIKALEKYGVKALISLPIEVEGRVFMYINFIETRYNKNWDEYTVEFCKDVKNVIQSIVIKRVTQNSLASSYTSLEAILENVGCGIYVRDLQLGKTLFVNQKMKKEFGDVIANDTFESMIRKCKREKEISGKLELYYQERKKWYDMNFMKIKWVDGREVSLCTAYDITERKLYQKKIEHQANNDFLTGLYNRMKCEADLDKVIKRAEVNEGSGALLFIDLDDFKHINDGLGHQYGDILLKEISGHLRNIEGLSDSCYRMGGDEFIIIVPEEYFYRLDRIIFEIKDIFSSAWYLKGADYYCTMSMGIAIFPQDGNNGSELIKKADIAMYEAKKKGKNCIEFYNQATESVSYKRLDLEKNMRNATADDFKEFQVYYQPIIDVNQPHIPCTGAEALIRWNSKKLGVISPAEFIPLAEYLGLINPIGDFVLETACRDCKSWNDNGYPNYKVNVNLSVVQLLQNNIVDKVASVLKKTGINPRNLTLEVTESLAINDMERMKSILEGIKSLGVRIALDDFGTGYSSLNHIKDMPLDVIKVDQCFVNDISVDSYACSFVKMVTELANTIGVTVCVEGVESRAQYEILKQMKVTLIQGFYFGKPMPADEFKAKYVK